MHRTSLLALSLFLLSFAGSTACEPPVAEPEGSPAYNQARETAQRRQGIATTLKGKVRSFSYGVAVAPDPFGPQPGCSFQLDTYSGKTLSVTVDGSDARSVFASDGMCRLALDSLKSASDISVATYDDSAVHTITL